MSALLARLNLRPQERRLMVAIAMAIFVALNIWTVWPHFKDWGRLQRENRLASDNLTLFKTEIEKQPQNRKKLEKLEGQGSSVLAEDQALQLLRTVQTQARQSGVQIPNSSPGTGGRPNEFFQEQAIRISVITGDKELVDFLVKLGSGNSMIRVRDLDLRPQLPAQQKLEGSMVLIASYQKKPAAKNTPPPKATGPAQKTGAATQKPPSATARPPAATPKAPAGTPKTSGPPARATGTNTPHNRPGPLRGKP